jgi:ribosomal protein S18 acetylase RimI-like enzyme
MTSALIPAIRPADPIRKLDMASDLNAVADLIELCFPIHQDPDGMTYVKEMRKTAQNLRLVGSLSLNHDLGPSRTTGFVWEDDGRILGNLSLIPLKKDVRRVHLIANVAVHPDYRRRGIARKLTQRALAYLVRHGESQVWLQVRDDNQPAVDLYRSLGFEEQAARTTWRIRPGDIKTGLFPKLDGLSMRRRMSVDWSNQRDWLDETYPQNIRWNLPVNFRRFSPGILQAFSNFMEGAYFKHWSVTLDGKCQGVITWQRAESFANNLWLAFPAETEDACLLWALNTACRRLPGRHPLSVDYPKGCFEKGFWDLGFTCFRTLVWMRCRL